VSWLTHATQKPVDGGTSDSSSPNTNRATLTWPRLNTCARTLNGSGKSKKN